MKLVQIANAPDMGFRLANLVQMYRSLNVNIAAMSYRGYGFSSGSPTEQGVLIDASTGKQICRFLFDSCCSSEVPRQAGRSGS